MPGTTPGPDRMGHDPINDENKLYNLSEFVLLVIHDLYDYWATFLNQNEFHRQKHTMHEWMASFTRWRSW